MANNNAHINDNENKKIKVRGYINGINFSNETINIRYRDILEFNGGKKVIPLDDVPSETFFRLNYSIKNLKKISMELFYQLYKDRQLLLFTINEKKQVDNKKYSIIGIEAIEENE